MPDGQEFRCSILQPLPAASSPPPASPPPRSLSPSAPSAHDPPGMEMKLDETTFKSFSTHLLPPHLLPLAELGNLFILFSDFICLQFPPNFLALLELFYLQCCVRKGREQKKIGTCSLVAFLSIIFFKVVASFSLCIFLTTSSIISFSFRNC